MFQTIIVLANFIILISSLFLFSIFYTISIQPVKRAKKYGEKAWRQCRTLRSIAGLFETVSVINYIMWIWFPLPPFDTWIISTNIWIGIVIAICIIIPCIIIMFLGLKAAGSESLTPSKETEMYGGIYKYIRHPQSLGEFPIYIALGFFLNSWFLVIISILFNVVYVPIMIYFEEKDLVLRFGDSYRTYQERTGALFPKLKK